MNKKLKVGDKVKINEASEYYGISKSNPKDVEGVITAISGEVGSLPFYVSWSNETRNNYEALDLIKVEAVKEKSIHDILVERSTLEVGDVVMVTHKVPSHDLGWDNSWSKGMDDAIGWECTVISKPDRSGVRLDDRGEDYNYPLQSVQFVRKGLQPITVSLAKDYDAIVSKDNIKVGCQTITFKAFDKLAEAVAKIRK
jgi:hypothetical protein